MIIAESYVADTLEGKDATQRDLVKLEDVDLKVQ